MSDLNIIQRRSHQERREATRTDILDACIESIAKSGYVKSSIAEIARGSNFTSGAIQHHFKSKSDLICAVVIERIFPVNPFELDHAVTSLPVIDRAQALVRQMWKYYGHRNYKVVWDIMLATQSELSIQNTISQFFKSAGKQAELHLQNVFPEYEVSSTDAKQLIQYASSQLRGLSLARFSRAYAPSIRPQLELLSRSIEQNIIELRKSR